MEILLSVAIGIAFVLTLMYAIGTTLRANKLDQKLSAKSLALSELLADNTRKDTEVSHLKDQLGICEATIVRLKKQISDNASTSNELVDQTAKLKENVSNAQKLLSDRESEIANLKLEAQKANAISNRIEEQLSLLSNNIIASAENIIRTANFKSVRYAALEMRQDAIKELTLVNRKPSAGTLTQEEFDKRLSGMDVTFKVTHLKD